MINNLLNLSASAEIEFFSHRFTNHKISIKYADETLLQKIILMLFLN